MLDKSEGGEWAYMKHSVCLPTLWKTLIIIYVTWNCILYTKRVSQRKRGETLPHNSIHRTFSAGNQIMETRLQNFVCNCGLKQKS